MRGNATTKSPVSGPGDIEEMPISCGFLARLRCAGSSVASRLNVPRGATFEDCVADGSVIAGTPQRVRDEIERQAAELGVNYLLTYLFLGAMTLEEALRSLALFSSEVMPRLAALIGVSFNAVGTAPL